MPIQEAYKALADPTRRRILKDLRSGERTAGELAEDAGIGRTALSHHLTVLKLADLVRVERRGQFQVYTLNTTGSARLRLSLNMKRMYPGSIPYEHFSRCQG